MRGDGMRTWSNICQGGEALVVIIANINSVADDGMRKFTSAKR
jgi:hypothetical protein